MPRTVNGLPFTCRNARFETDIKVGFAHGANQALRSVLPQPLISAATNGGYSLWLEYLIDQHNTMTGHCFWLMWYDAAGQPTLTMSGVFDKSGLAEMIKGLTIKGL